MDGLRTALFVRLNGTSAVTDLLTNTSAIYHRRAPLNTAFPFIILDKQSGIAIWSFGGPPIDNQLWMVKAVDKSPSASKAEDIYRQVDAALTDAPLALSDGSLLYLRRESDIDYEEGTDPDYMVHHVGGLYRTMIDRT